MSNVSGQLVRFQRVIVENYRKRNHPDSEEVECKRLFTDISIDGVLVNSTGGITLVEVALGGNGKFLKEGPKRKILSDAFKLISAVFFLREPRAIIKRVIIVRDSEVASKLTGWNRKALFEHKIDVIPADLDAAQAAEVGSILSQCIDEMSG